MEERMDNARTAEEPIILDTTGYDRVESVDDYDELINAVCPGPTRLERAKGLLNKWLDHEQAILYRDIYFVGRVIAAPIFGIAWAIKKYRQWTYDPAFTEKEVCPACGFKGCRLNFVKTASNEPDKKAMVEATCNRCSARFYFKTLRPLDKWWVDPEPQKPQAGIRRII